MPIKNSFHGTVRAIHQMAGRSECEAREARRLSLTASRAEHARISGRSGNNSAYLEFCLRIAEKFIGNEGPITVDQVLAGEKLNWLVCLIKGHKKYPETAPGESYDLLFFEFRGHRHNVVLNICARCGKLYAEFRDR